MLVDRELMAKSDLNDIQFSTEEQRWNALKERNKSCDGTFYFAVLTTGVYCKPSCGARLPNRENVRFYDTMDTAEKHGFRPCKRCKPGSPELADRHAEIVTKVCNFIHNSEEEPSLNAMAAVAEMSPHYFNRTFKKVTGITPKQYVIGLRSEALKTELTNGNSVTAALYSAGYNTSSRFYEGAKPRLGMSPSKFKAGGTNIEIRYTIEPCWLGNILVAATGQGVCSILFGDNEADLEQDLTVRFPHASLEASDTGSDFKLWVNKVLQFIKQPDNSLRLPLDIHGTVFQERVWRALQTIPAGETASYAEVAKKIGKPKASRAVASACAANPIAVVIPCHRVVRKGGAISGYRWGKERKQQLLERESTP